MRCPTLLLLSALPCFAQAPKLIIPSPNGLPDQDSPAKSVTLATPKPPASLDRLGPLKESLYAYFAMDDKETGGLTWSKEPLTVPANPPVAVKRLGAHTYLDFSAPRALLAFSPNLKPGGTFTIAAWLKTPSPTQNADLWSGPGGDYIWIRNQTKIAYWSTRTQKEETWADAAKPLHGWQHVALVVTPGKVQAYLDAKPLAFTADLDVTEISTVGNHRTRSDNFMTGGVDEMYVFSRALSADEITTLMKLNNQP